MPPRFDDSTSTLSLSVGDLIEAPGGRHLGFGRRGGYERMWLGQAIHSRYLEQALAEDASYRREVVLEHELVHKGWQIRIHGRADGLRREEQGGLVVEEIKSIRRAGQVPPASLELWQRQALIYAWMLSASREEAVRAELVLIEIGSDAVQKQPLDARLDGIGAGVLRRIGALLGAHLAQKMRQVDQRRTAAFLRFPYRETRAGQEEIIEAVDRALEQGDHLLVEAPTGLGKTVSALFPALKHALEHGRKVFVLTAKTLQQEMAGSVIELLNEEGSFRSLRLRAKAKMCANSEVICHEEYCSFARDYYLKLHASGVLRRLLEDRPDLDPDTIHAAARDAEVCPFEVSLQLSEHAQVVVCDYNYAFDPYVALEEFGEESDLSETVLVIDEIHNLVGRGRGYYSPELSSEIAHRAGETMGRGGDPVHREISSLCYRLATLIETAVDFEVLEDRGSRECTLPEDDLWQLRPEFDALFVDYLEFRKETRSFVADDLFVELYFNLLRFLNVLTLMAAQSEVFRTCLERRGEDRALRVICLDPGPFLGQILGRVHSAIGLSATLSPPDFYLDLLGFDRQRSSAISLPSPFPTENRRVVIDPAVITTWKRRPENYHPIAQRLGAFADNVPGNCLALFPSYDFLARVSEHLTPQAKRVFIQQRADSDGQREAILAALRGALLGDILLLAVAGGVFAEGVDYPGDTLRAVAVIGPCLPGLSLELELLRRYYDERFERGFEYASVVPGMTRVVQAAGRLIRSPEDIGVIALFGERFLIGPYRNHLPVDWIPDSGLQDLTGTPSRAAEAFFKTAGKIRASRPAELPGAGSREV